MKSLVQRLLLASLLVLLLGGCASNAKLGGLTARLVNVVPTGATSAKVTLEYSNDNLLPVGVSRSQHDITLNGVALKRVSIDTPVGVPRLAKADQVITVELPSATLSALDDGSLSYQIQSLLFIDAGEDVVRSKSTASGIVPVNASR